MFNTDKISNEALNYCTIVAKIFLKSKLAPIHGIISDKNIITRRASTQIKSKTCENRKTAGSNMYKINYKVQI